MAAESPMTSQNLWENVISLHNNLYSLFYACILGKTGRPLSLMLKQSPLIDELCVYDIKPTCGFAMELGHVDTKCKVSSYTGKDSISHALQVFNNKYSKNRCKYKKLLEFESGGSGSSRSKF